jgi:phosphoribosyl-ATP pyrophosphohydrolase/phosphoribosyl-AMP cyclohydrolase
MTDRSDVLARLDQLIEERMKKPSTGYTDDLLSDRNKRMKKIGEEAAELVVACVDQNELSVAEEAADLIYHVLVAIRAAGVSLADVEDILEGRVK